MEKGFFSLPPLPYAYDALEPYIDAKTMEVHHNEHHAAYVNNLNKALAAHPGLTYTSVQDLLLNLNHIPEPTRTAVRNNGGGHYNHSMFWTIMSKNGGGEPKKGNLSHAIERDFGSFAQFQEQFNAAAKSVFGSGWAWLFLNKKERLEIRSAPNQDNPLLQEDTPILGLDVWEHAYYLKYMSKRVNYIDAWWHVVNWGQVEDNLRALVK